MHSSIAARLTQHRSAAVLLFAAALLVIGSTPASAQSTSAQTYEQFIRPQEERHAAAVAEIMARPSNWGPGEIRDNANYGAISWYEKGGGEYGYIVARGYISPTSAQVQMMMECDQRRVTCQGTRLVSNQWLAIGKRNDVIRYVTAAGRTRDEATAVMAEQCRAEGGDCTVLDVFDINPNRRGMSFLRPRVEQH